MESLIYLWIVRAAMFGVGFAHDIGNSVEELNYLLISINILVFEFFPNIQQMSLCHIIYFLQIKKSWKSKSNKQCNVTNAHKS